MAVAVVAVAVVVVVIVVVEYLLSLDVALCPLLGLLSRRLINQGAHSSRGCISSFVCGVGCFLLLSVSSYSVWLTRWPELLERPFRVTTVVLVIQLVYIAGSFQPTFVNQHNLLAVLK